MSRHSLTLPPSGPLVSELAAGPVRDLAQEVGAIHAWLQAHQAVSPNSISLEAGLGRNSITSLTRENDPENPTVSRLDKLYGAMRQYGFQPTGPGLLAALGAEATAQLLHLAARGYVLTQERADHWVVIQLRPPAPGQPSWVGETEAGGLTPAIALEQAIALLATISGSLDAEQPMN